MLQQHPWMADNSSCCLFFAAAPDWHIVPHHTEGTATQLVNTHMTQSSSIPIHSHAMLYILLLRDQVRSLLPTACCIQQANRYSIM
jgi:hypothetical protein